MPGDVFSAPEHLPPPLKKVVRSQEEIEKSALRLSTPRKVYEANDKHFLAPHITKSKEEQESMIRRLYDQAVEKEKKRKEQQQQAEAAELTANTKKLAEEEVAEGVNRLYHKAIEQQRMQMNKLNESYLFTGPKSPRKMTVEECTQRVYKEALERQAEGHQKLHAKYVASTMVSPRKLTKAEQDACASRLCVTKSAQ